MDNFRKIVMNFVNEFSRWEKQGKGLYLWKQDTGKWKNLPCLLPGKIIDDQIRLTDAFITAPDYIDMVGEKIKRARGEEDQTKVFHECDVLVLDDIGAQSGGEWQRQEIFRLVNDRMETGKITIYTSNMSTDSLNVDSRTRDRIVKASVELQMPEESLRRKKAEMEQQQFLREVL